MRTIEILNLNCKPSLNGLTNVVESIIFQVTDTVTINGTEHEVRGGNFVQLSDPNPAEFTPFESLTEAVVVGWVEANADVDGFVARLTDNLNTRLNPPTVALTPPWNS